MTKKLHKGFTLIELLVVIAIIGILSSIVLASLNSARNKAADAAIKGDLNGIRSQAALYFDDPAGGNQSYGTPGESACASTLSNMFIEPHITNAITHAVLQNGGNDGYCSTTGQAFAVAVPLRSSGVWCVDSNGVSRSATAAGVPYTVLTDAIPVGTSSCQ